MRNICVVYLQALISDILTKIPTDQTKMFNVDELVMGLRSFNGFWLGMHRRDPQKDLEINKVFILYCTVHVHEFHNTGLRNVVRAGCHPWRDDEPKLQVYCVLRKLYDQISEVIKKNSSHLNIPSIGHMRDCWLNYE